MTLPKKPGPDAGKVIPISTQESNRKPPNTTTESAEFRYNRRRNRNNVGGNNPEPPRRKSDVTVVAPSQPPVIDPQVGRVLLQILLHAVRDQQQPGTGTIDPRAA